MNKPLGVLVGIVVIAGALNTAGAWYTGTKLQGELEQSLEQANVELAQQLKGTPTSATIELASFERNLYSSTAHYRVDIQDDRDMGKPPMVFLLVDHIEHGPLPWSRIKTFKWMPVMATSNYSLVKTPFTEKWFEAAKDQSPLKGQVTIGYNRSIDGDLALLPLEAKLDENANFIFSGLTLSAQSDADGKNVKGKGYMDHLEFVSTTPGKPRARIELNGLTVASDLNKSAFGFYLGQNVLELSEGQLTFGERPSVAKVKNFEYAGSASANGNLMSGRLSYNVGDFTLDDKPVGSAQMIMTASSLDIPSMQSLLTLYQTKFQPQPDGTKTVAPLTQAEQTQMQADVKQMLTAKPQLALEKFTIKTANGQSDFNLAVSLAPPTTFEQPPLELTQQVLTSLNAKLVLSKPMIADLSVVQAQLAGQTDPQTIEKMANMNSEMAGVMAVQTGVAQVEGNNILASLNYAAGQVDFNGQKMSLEDFINLMITRFGNGPDRL
ncbi:YdgA family protein [Pseudomonas sp. NPDC096917]|uniref:YdgA family protein n=1 Tax=Pseudomonas sp. NPDC096917 TaxID=3364483 RepID=UPI00383B2284